MKGRTIVISIVLFISLCALIAAPISSAESESDYLLFDMGNGDTEWARVRYSYGDDINEVFRRAAEGIGIPYERTGDAVAISGIGETTIGTGSGGGSFKTPGNTANIVVSSWKLFLWDDSSKVWVPQPMVKLSEPYSGGSFAFGFFPNGVVPLETPLCRTSWTMVRGDSEQSGNQRSTFTVEDKSTVKWSDKRGGIAGVYSTILSVQGYVFVKFGCGSGMSSGEIAALNCYTMDGSLVWSFEFPGINFYETATPLIVGDNIYVTSGLGYIFKIPWRIGPGDDNANVTTFDGTAYNTEDVMERKDAIPYETGAELTGSGYSTGCGSLISDSGCIYCMSSNGMVYCFDLNLNLIWSYQMSGHMYYNSPTVFDEFVFAGALDGKIYVINKKTGECVCSDTLYTRIIYGKPYGSVNNVTVHKEGGSYVLFASISDGRGMSSTVGGLARCIFNGSSIVSKNIDIESFGMLPNYLTKMDNVDFKGVCFASTEGFHKVDCNGRSLLLNTSLPEIHAPATLVNDEYVYLSSYTSGKSDYVLSTDGKILYENPKPPGFLNFSMSPMTIIGDYVLTGNDNGVYCNYGVFPEYVEPVMHQGPWWHIPLVLSICSVTVLVAVWCGLRFIGKKERPFEFLIGHISHYIGSDEYTHNTKNKHRLWMVMVLGLIAIVSISLLSIAVGPTDLLDVRTALSSLVSAIGKDGNNLTPEEVLVYSSRFPRTLAAISVGIGLSIAGSVYQAIIRNPLVDPYILGISSGAGTAAIAVMAFDFTLFGLLSSHSPFLIATSAMIGGTVAFICTMILAEKSGGSSVNYVLAGIVVGLAFSAVQTTMMSFAGHRISNVLIWLFGSFSNVSWTHLWVIVVPAITLSLIPLIWAKEFNLVLLGEEQARQMGLNVKAFNISMLTLASILTSSCVAFVGVIGFIGLVVPHLCRMVLGGDHRLVMPMSIVLGASLMLLADIAARMAFFGQELPVGAITTLIGVPVFAWLLIRKGRMYDG